MKKTIVILMILSLVSVGQAEINGWWGQVSFRQRHETTKEYTDFTFTGDPGTLRYTEDNSRTMLGYQIGFRMNLTEQTSAAVTLRSGLGSVMWQNIDSNSGLMPGIQEAYITWNTSYAKLEFGRIPQAGNTFWDLYACSKQLDWRQHNPVDGIFNDRMASLNGVRIKVPVGPVTLRALYHTDYTGGTFRDWEPGTNREDERDLDWKVFVLGAKVKHEFAPLKAQVEFDYGLPYRMGDIYRTGRDSVYFDEDIWGVSALLEGKCKLQTTLSLGYAKNWRDSLFTADFYDIMASVTPIRNVYTPFFRMESMKVSVRYQENVQEHEFGLYIGHEAIRKAFHAYLTFNFGDFELQPRYIMLTNQIGGPRQPTKDQRTLERYEITATVRF